jgi:hypothetical protein
MQTAMFLPAYAANKINIKYFYSSTVLDIIHRPVFYLKLNTIGLSVPHMEHITSPLRAQQVNAIYRFVTTVYQHTYHNSGTLSIVLSFI